MMGPVQSSQPQLFQYGINLEKRVRANNPLRAIAKAIDFSFVREEVKGFYGQKGHESEDPIVIVKLMLLLFLDDQPSERELMRVVGERLDYLWFLGFDLEDEIPNHSVLSKARRRWGREVFEKLFVRTVQCCVESGLVDGKKIHMDGVLINGNASKDSVRRGPGVLMEQLKQVYRREEQKLDDKEEEQGNAGVQMDNGYDGGTAKANRADGEDQKLADVVNGVELKASHEACQPTPVMSIVHRNNIVGRRGNAADERLVSRTDPETAVVRKGAGDGARPRFKQHRAVDDRFGVITAIETTAGDIAENTKLLELVDQHECHTGKKVDTVVADAQYGTNDNFAACHHRGIRSHMADLKATYRNDSSLAVFREDQFQYDAANNVYACPAGKTLQPKRMNQGMMLYTLSRTVCRSCALRAQCTRSKGARTLKRHPEHERVQAGREQSHGAAAQRDRRRRRHLMEGSFADGANNHGLKRARWRGLKNQQTQDYLIAACQNLRLLGLLGRAYPPVKAMRRGVCATKHDPFPLLNPVRAGVDRFAPMVVFSLYRCFSAVSIANILGRERACFQEL